MAQTLESDICIVGSGAGAGPVAYELAKSGYEVVILEKGAWYREEDFYKDEELVRHRIFRSDSKKEPHLLEEPEKNGSWSRRTTGRFWGGNIVGGASNFMSGYFHRLKPVDFRLRSTFGPIEGANVVDWPIQYEDLEPYYSKVERIVGVSGRVVPHKFLEPRSTPDYPFPPTAEHPISARFDSACREIGLSPLPLARAILSRPHNGRRSCEYSGYCGSYGCSSGAKGSSRAALIDEVVKGGNCRVLDRSRVYRLNTNSRGLVTSAEYFDQQGEQKRVRAKIFVVACYSIESVRLLLNSQSAAHPDGIGNRYGQVGKNLHCCAGGTGHGIFDLSKLTGRESKALRKRGPFFNRALQDWYIIDDKKSFPSPVKGGTIDFVFDPPSPTAEANKLKWKDGELLFGTELKQRIKSHFTKSKDFKFEVFCDWLPNQECYVALDSTTRDAWGIPVARVRVGTHPHDLKVGSYLVERGKEVMHALGAHTVFGNAFSSPTYNLIAGGLRFGNDPTTSALGPDCAVHGVENLYVTDGSFMPTGGSVTPTFTIYANAFRVADTIKARRV